MEQHIIKYNNKEYVVAEPTIMVWNALNNSQVLDNEEDFRLHLISVATGLDMDEIKQVEWWSVYEISDYLMDYYMVQSPQFYPSITFNDINYKFVDLEHITFGEFIDIDTFLSQPASYRMGNMNYLMALLYRETDENGVLQKYDGSKVENRSKTFRYLPSKYLQGALFFLEILESTLQEHITSSLVKKLWMKMNRMYQTIKLNLLSSVGAGIQLSYIWHKKILTRLRK
jgi:hypothetical protein